MTRWAGWLGAGFLALTAANSLTAHPGGLNAEGCHNNRKTGDYHCHGKPVPPPPPKPAPQGAWYANCDAARAAGVAPMRRGEPGYRPGLDRDNDGIACEPRR